MQPPTVAGVDVVSMLISVCVATVLVLGEELAWRGFLLPRIQQLTTRSAGAILTAVAHAAVHLPLIVLTSTYNSVGSRWVIAPLTMVTIVGAAIFYAWLRDVTRSIWLAALAHAAGNTLLAFTSATALPTAAVSMAYVAGDGGVVTAVTMTAAAVAVLRHGRRRVWRAEPTAPLASRSCAVLAHSSYRSQRPVGAYHSQKVTPMNPLRWPLVLLSALLGLIAFPLLVGGAALVATHLALRDADGYYDSAAYGLSTTSNAVVLDGVDLDVDGPFSFAPLGRSIATTRIAAREAKGGPVFVGVAPRADVDAYLTGVAHERITDVGPSRLDTRPVPGSGTVSRPTEQPFWVASAVGSGQQELTWPVQEGRWAVVVMNADAAPGIDLTASAAVHIEYLSTIAMTTLILGVLTLLGAISAGLTAGRRTGTPIPGPLNEGQAYPLVLNAECDIAPSRWLWAVKWILALPHLAALACLWVAFIVLTLAAGVMIVITGRYPRSLFDFNVGVMRWTWRVGHYSYLTLGTDQYPPFTLTAPPFPASLDISYPERLSRGLVLIKWLLAIPHLAVVGILIGTTRAFGLLGRGPDSPFPTGLIGLLVVVAAAHLVLLRAYPRGLFNLLLGLNRWVFRTVAYLGLMTDVYPPFRLDLGRPGPGASTEATDATTAVDAAELVGSPA